MGLRCSEDMTVNIFSKFSCIILKVTTSLETKEERIDSEMFHRILKKIAKKIRVRMSLPISFYTTGFMRPSWLRFYEGMVRLKLIQVYFCCITFEPYEISNIASVTFL